MGVDRFCGVVFPIERELSEYHIMEVRFSTIFPLNGDAGRGSDNVPTDQGIWHRVRFPVTWEMLLEGERLIPAWGVGGRVWLLCLSLSYFLIARSDEISLVVQGKCTQRIA